MIQGKISCDSFASRIVSESGDKDLARKETLGAAMSTLQKRFAALDPKVRTHVLNAALTATIELLPKLNNMGGEIKPYVVFDHKYYKNITR